MRIAARAELCALVVALSAASIGAQQYTFTHYAGSPGGPGMIDATGTEARFSAPQGIARDPSGNLFIADTRAHSIRRVSSAGVVTTFVGRWDDADEVDGPPADARFFQPRDITRDAAGNLYVVTNTTVRKITPLGVVSTLATGLTGFSIGKGIAFDATTNSVFVTNGDHTVRKISMAGAMTTFAGLSGTPGSDNGAGSAIRFLNPTGIAVDSLGWVYVADGNHIIRKISPAGLSSTLAGQVGVPGHTNLTGTNARFNNPRGLAVDAAGYVYVADAGNNAVRKITPLGVVSTLAGGTEGYLDAMTTTAKFNLPSAVDVDGAVNVYVVEEENHTVRRIAPDGTVTTIAGLGIVNGFIQGAVTTARFNGATGMGFDSGGNLFVAEAFNNDIRKITPGVPDTVSLFAGGTSGGLDGSGAAAQFRAPNGLTIDGADIVWVADTVNHTIRKITTAGAVTTFAGTAQMSGTTNANGTAARFSGPTGIAIDGAGNLFVADNGNFAIRKITPARDVTTFAGQAGTFGALDHATGTSARFSYPSGIVRDPSTGNFYVTDQTNYCVRKITPASAVTTFAGALGVSSSPFVDATGNDARFSQPRALTIDGSSNLYVIDTNVVRKITPGAAVTTIAGNRDLLGSEDGTGAVAHFVSPSKIHSEADGTLYVTDFGTQSIKRGTPALSVFATIDSPSGPIDVSRALSSANHFLGVSYTWRVIRRPPGSTAALSATTGRNVTFTPDVPDLYVFRQTATSIIGQMSITDVSLLATCSAVAVSPSSLPHPLLGNPYSQSLSGSGGMSGPFTFAISSGSIPTGLTLSSTGTLSGTPDTPGDYTFTVVATGARGCPGARTYTLTVGTLPPPTGTVAAANSGSSVLISWNPVPGASGYRIYRQPSNASPNAAIGTTGTTSFTDSATVSAAALYRVRAYDASNIESGDSNYDLAVVYLSPVSVSGIVNAFHVELLRFVVDEVLELGGQTVTPYTDPTLDGVTIKEIHLTQLRTRANQARTALGYTALAFTDPSPAGVVVKAIHWNEIWNGLQ